MMRAAIHVPAIGDILHRVDGQCIDDGSETYQGMELFWTTWRVVRLTPCGAWLQCVERHWKKQRFALSSGARWVSRTQEEALQALIARKRRQLAIVSQQEVMAQETLELATAAKARAAQLDGGQGETR
jgi:hypothetical protein